MSCVDTISIQPSLCLGPSISDWTHCRIFMKFLMGIIHKLLSRKSYNNPYPTAFPYGNGMVLHFYQQQESGTTKTVHKVINKGLKAYV